MIEGIRVQGQPPSLKLKTVVPTASTGLADAAAAAAATRPSMPSTPSRARTATGAIASRCNLACVSTPSHSLSVATDGGAKWTNRDYLLGTSTFR